MFAIPTITNVTVNVHNCCKMITFITGVGKRRNINKLQKILLTNPIPKGFWILMPNKLLQETECEKEIGLKPREDERCLA